MYDFLNVYNLYKCIKGLAKTINYEKQKLLYTYIWYKLVHSTRGYIKRICLHAFVKKKKDINIEFLGTIDILIISFRIILLEQILISCDILWMFLNKNEVFYWRSHVLCLSLIFIYIYIWNPFFLNKFVQIKSCKCLSNNIL